MTGAVPQDQKRLYAFLYDVRRCIVNRQIYHERTRCLWLPPGASVYPLQPRLFFDQSANDSCVPSRKPNELRVE